ncbi:MAG TPA: 16S rRNA (guanine(966)-N(2))-methyltransferase RsmD [Terriglobia bacterium]|nr:16S rRNA (guanine(966)-N(2))-methyltransferase RsmD [Terriglobia bacterium]
MRIIAGSYRGLCLKTLGGEALRPTSDQMRETLFDVLAERIRGARFLDLFAGSGAVGLEALSRGASEVVFVERRRQASELIRKNLLALGICSGFRVMPCRAETAISRLADEDEQFDFVFLDPPYAEIREYHTTLRECARSGILNPGAVVIAEHSRHCRIEERYGSLARFRLLRHGDSQLGFYRIEESQSV